MENLQKDPTIVKTRKSGKVETLRPAVCSDTDTDCQRYQQRNINDFEMTTTQTVLLDFSIHQERDITESLQIIEDVFNKHLKSVNWDFSCLKLECKIAGETLTTKSSQYFNNLSRQNYDNCHLQ